MASANTYKSTQQSTAVGSEENTGKEEEKGNTYIELIFRTELILQYNSS